MDGVHDLGGMDGFGAVEPEYDEPRFHQRWEGRAFAMSVTMTATGVWNIDVGRHGIERLPPAVYLTSSYYERWLRRLERLLIEYGLLTAEELADGQAAGAAPELRNGPLTPDQVPRMLKRGTFVRDSQAPPHFKPGQRVRARNVHPHSHTRLPRYVRGHIGVVERLHGANVYPDSVVRGDGEDPQWLYTVRFEGHDLWGDDGEPGTTVSIDAFEPYLESAS